MGARVSLAKRYGKGLFVAKGAATEVRPYILLSVFCLLSSDSCLIQHRQIQDGVQNRAENVRTTV